ncbi:MAG: type II toxin-antitoxin system RelE/ParE family toxin [Thermoleophilia bacterium]
MIKGFRGREAEKIWQGRISTRLPLDIQRVARRKLRMLNGARSIEDLRIPPGNALEALKGDRAGAFSIRINDQWRLCFRWVEGDAHDVEIADYH